MGLDIRFYKKLTLIEEPERDEYGEIDFRKYLEVGDIDNWQESYFPGRAKGVEARRVYSFEENDGFRAGGYIGYGIWRRKLSDFAVNTDFFELINFSDCEGIIGSEVSKKLAGDFKKNSNRASEFSKTFEGGEHWLEMYKTWQNAFEFASDNGAVEFS